MYYDDRKKETWGEIVVCAIILSIILTAIVYLFTDNPPPSPAEISVEITMGPVNPAYEVGK